MALSLQEKIEMAKKYNLPEELIQQQIVGSQGALEEPSLPQLPTVSQEDGENGGLLQSLIETFLPKTTGVFRKGLRGETPSMGLLAPPFIEKVGGGEVGAAGRELGSYILSPKIGKVALAPKKFIGKQIERAARQAGVVPEQMLDALRAKLGTQFSQQPNPELYERLAAELFPKAKKIIRGELAALQPRMPTTPGPEATFLDLLKRRAATGKAGFEQGAATAMRPVYKNIQRQISGTLKEGVPQLKVLDPLYGGLQKASEITRGVGAGIKRAIPWALGSGISYALLKGLGL